MTATDPTPDIPLHRVQVWACDLCITGAGGECHVPGCMYWAKDAPTGVDLAWLQDHAIPAPRVWFDGDEVPAGVWVYKADGDCVEPDDRIEMLDPDEPIINGNHGSLVEIVLPDVEAIVEAAEQARSAGGAL